MVKLTPKLIATEIPDEKYQSLQKLALPGREIEKIVRLSACSQLIRLDLSNNRLTSLEGVSQNITLKWLAAPGNQISTLQGLDSLNQLQVLNLGHNKLQGHMSINGMSSLRALMLNDNMLTGISGLDKLPELNTLILKQNQITDLGTSLHGCTALAKLQIGHNRLKQLGSALSEASSLAELRVSYNELASLPQELARNVRLKIVEVGNNPISAFQDIKVVSQLPSLHQLSLRGCPIAEGLAYPDSVLQHLSGLDVLDSKKLAKSGMPRHSHKAHSAAAMNTSAGLNPAQRAAVQGPSSDVDQLQDSSAQQSLHSKRVKQQRAVNDTNKKAKRKLEAADDDRADDGSHAAPAKKHQSVKHELGNSVNAPAADAALRDAQGTDTAQQEGKKKVKKQKIDKQKHAAQSQADQQGRSFLADVLDPEIDGVLDQQIAKAAKAPKADGAPKGQSADSGLLKVIETLPSKEHKSKAAKQKKSNVPSGSAAVELLQTRAGLSSVQVGMGAMSSWD